MSFIVGLLIFILVANCLLLIFLVLVQLPKKDAGAGIAFGGGTADALFGAGSGNALTKITKWATGIFLALALLVGYMEDRLHMDNSSAEFAKQVQQKQMQSAAPAPAPVPQSTPSTPGNNNLLLTTPNPTATNAAK